MTGCTPGCSDDEADLGLPTGTTGPQGPRKTRSVAEALGAFVRHARPCRPNLNRTQRFHLLTPDAADHEAGAEGTEVPGAQPSGARAGDNGLCDCGRPYGPEGLSFGRSSETRVGPPCTVTSVGKWQYNRRTNREGTGRRRGHRGAWYYTTY